MKKLLAIPILYALAFIGSNVLITPAGAAMQPSPDPQTVSSMLGSSTATKTSAPLPRPSEVGGPGSTLAPERGGVVKVGPTSGLGGQRPNGPGLDGDDDGSGARPEVPRRPVPS